MNPTPKLFVSGWRVRKKYVLNQLQNYNFEAEYSQIEPKIEVINSP